MKIFLAVFNAFPAILQSVLALESAIQLPRAGEHKLNLVLNAAAAAWDAGHNVNPLSKTDTLSLVQTITNATVAGLNASGVFKPAAAGPATPPAPVSSN